jgi:hypothetical protein
MPRLWRARKTKIKTKKMTELILATANGIDLRHIGWKYYNEIKKKAMDKSSVSGLVIFLSIAFFIAIFVQ